MLFSYQVASDDCGFPAAEHITSGDQDGLLVFRPFLSDEYVVGQIKALLKASFLPSWRTAFELQCNNYTPADDDTCYLLFAAPDAAQELLSELRQSDYHADQIKIITC